jgi:hypothetical protein
MLHDSGDSGNASRRPATLLSRYEQIDREVEQLEIATAKAEVTWDQMVESEVDRAREGD